MASKTSDNVVSSFLLWWQKSAVFCCRLVLLSQGGSWGSSGAGKRAPGPVWGDVAGVPPGHLLATSPWARSLARSPGVLIYTVGTSASIQDRVRGTGFTLPPETIKKPQTDQIHETEVYQNTGHYATKFSDPNELSDYLSLLPCVSF